MRPIRSVLLVVGAILVVGVLAPNVSASSTPRPLHLTKDCSTYTGETPTYCTIMLSDLAAIPTGTKVWYKGPVLTNSYFLSRKITLDAGDGNTASGYCIAVAKTSVGLCTFWKGTGTLAGFTTVVDVTIDATGLWHWDGEYYFSDEVEASPATVEASPAIEVVVTTVLTSQDTRPW